MLAMCFTGDLDFNVAHMWYSPPLGLRWLAELAWVHCHGRSLWPRPSVRSTHLFKMPQISFKLLFKTQVIVYASTIVTGVFFATYRHQSRIGYRAAGQFFNCRWVTIERVSQQLNHVVYACDKTTMMCFGNTELVLSVNTNKVTVIFKCQRCI